MRKTNHNYIIKCILCLLIAAALSLCICSCTTKKSDNSDSPQQTEAASSQYRSEETESRFSPDSSGDGGESTTAADTAESTQADNESGSNNSGDPNIDTSTAASSGTDTQNASESQAETRSETGANAQAGAQSDTGSSTAAYDTAVYSESSDGSSDTGNPNTQSTSQSVCTLLVNCEKAISSGKLGNSMLSVLPQNGVLFSGSCEFTPGESVYDVLARELKAGGIPLETSYTPSLGSMYIEGINSLYEFDCGELSGWVYFVNGSMPSVGCDKYILTDGDDVRWYYTLDLGHDIDF